MKTKTLKISQLRADYGANVRFADNYGDISDLANNIQAKGLLVPLTVEPLDNGTFGIISGHRRFAALKLLIEQGVYTDAETVLCTVESYANELERAAAKLLTNDSQALTADEIACSIADLAERIKAENPKADFIQDIAAVMGKRPEYVKEKYETWSKLNDQAKKIIQSGKVGMTLAGLIARKSESDKIASLGVQLASAAKEKVKDAGQTVSDAVIADAVLKTKDKLIQGAQTGQQMTGAAIGADLLANILQAKAANKAGASAKAAVKAGKVSLSDYIQDLINEAAPGSNRDILQQLVMCYRNNTGANEALQMIFDSKASKAA